MIDSAISIDVPSVRSLFPYLSDWWRDYITESGFTGPEATALFPPTTALGAPTAGGLPDAPVAALRPHLDSWGATHGILYPRYGVTILHNEDLAAALSGAVNDWQREVWLAGDARLRGSIVVPAQNTAQAVAEIDRLGAEPGFVQVALPVRSEAPYGKRRFWPIFEAAVRHELPVAIYAGGAAGTPSTPVGRPSYAVEEYVAYAQAFAAQLISLIAEGVFTSFPDLRVVLAGSGCTWLPSLLWRFDKNWKGLRREVPWLTRPPSHYLRAQVRLTIAPFDGPRDAAHLVRFHEYCGSDELLLLSSDFPYGDPTAPGTLLPAGLPEKMRAGIADGHARALYRL